MKDAIDLDLYTKIAEHREARKAAGKFRCGYERTVVRFTGDIDEATKALGPGDWVCSECGEVIATREPDSDD